MFILGHTGVGSPVRAERQGEETPGLHRRRVAVAPGRTTGCGVRRESEGEARRLPWGCRQGWSLDGREAGTLAHTTRPPLRHEQQQQKCVLSDGQRVALLIRKTLMFQLGVKILSPEETIIWEMEGRHRY